MKEADGLRNGACKKMSVLEYLQSAQKPHHTANLARSTRQTPFSSESLLTRAAGPIDVLVHNLGDLLDSPGAEAVRGS